MPSLPADPRKRIPIRQDRVIKAQEELRKREAERDVDMRGVRRSKEKPDGLSIRELAELSDLSTARVQQVLNPNRKRSRKKAAA